MVFDVNDLTVFDAKNFFLDGYTCSDEFEIAERFELSPDDTLIVCDFLERYQSMESQVSTKSIMNLDNMTFIFGTFNDSFKFESKVNHLNFDDYGENITLKVGNFIMSLPDQLIKFEVGDYIFFYGYASDICYRFFYSKA